MFFGSFLGFLDIFFGAFCNNCYLCTNNQNPQHMNNFTFYSPTEFCFGRGREQEVGQLCVKYGAHRVMIVYGGGSVVRSGLLDRVKASLDAVAIPYIEMGGVRPNPTDPKVYEGLALARSFKPDFMLAVGGGSVIDTAKTIAAGYYYEGDFWDFFIGKAKVGNCLPVGVVLTIPAAGSEMSESSVITNEDGDVKLGYSNNISRPKFAIMNPVRTYTLPSYQTAAGVTDMIMHTMERYFTHDDDMTLTDSMAEALMRTLKDSVMEVLKNPTDYRHRAQIMWGGSIAHNGLTGCGLSDDWATHQLEHELSGMFDATHGAGLAAIWPSWARYVYKENVSRFVRFAVNVMGVENDFTNPEATALKGIEAMEEFYHAIGMPINIHELIGREVTDKEIREMVRKCSRNYTTTQGRFKVLQVEDMEAIYRMAK